VSEALILVNSRVRSVNFSHDGKTLVSGSWDNTIKLWNESTGQEILTLKGHEGPVWSVNFSPDEGKTLVSGSDDGTIKLWNVEIVQTLKGHDDLVNSVNFSPEGNTLVSSSDDESAPSRGMITLSEALILVPTARLW